MRRRKWWKAHKAATKRQSWRRIVRQSTNRLIWTMSDYLTSSSRHAPQIQTDTLCSNACGTCYHNPCRGSLGSRGRRRSPKWRTPAGGFASRRAAHGIHRTCSPSLNAKENDEKSVKTVLTRAASQILEKVEDNLQLLLRLRHLWAVFILSLVDKIDISYKLENWFFTRKLFSMFWFRKIRGKSTIMQRSMGNFAPLRFTLTCSTLQSEFYVQMLAFVSGKAKLQDSWSEMSSKRVRLVGGVGVLFNFHFEIEPMHRAVSCSNNIGDIWNISKTLMVRIRNRS